MDKAGTGKFCQPHKIDMHVLRPAPSIWAGSMPEWPVYHIRQCEAQARHRVHAKDFGTVTAHDRPHQYKVSLYGAACCISLPHLDKNGDFAFKETQRVWRQRVSSVMRFHHLTYINLMIPTRIYLSRPAFAAAMTLLR